MSEETGRTQAQDDAIKKAWDILTEHFETVLLVVDVETDSGDDAHQIFWHGGFLPAVGAAEYAKHQMLNSPTKGGDSTEP